MDGLGLEDMNWSRRGQKKKVFRATISCDYDEQGNVKGTTVPIDITQHTLTELEREVVQSRGQVKVQICLAEESFQND